MNVMGTFARAALLFVSGPTDAFEPPFIKGPYSGGYLPPCVPFFLISS